MKIQHLFACTLVALCSGVSAQQTIYRCGNEYTNDGFDAKARGCKPIGGGNLTVVPTLTTLPPAPPAGNSSAPKGAASSAQKVDTSEQRARDADAKAILELQKLIELDPNFKKQGEIYINQIKEGKLQR